MLLKLLIMALPKSPALESLRKFSCKEEVDWEVQFYPSNDVDELMDALGGLQFFAVMTVDLVNIAKPKNRAVGGIRVVGGAAGGQQQQQPMQQN